MLIKNIIDMILEKAEKASKSRRGGSSDANSITLVNKFSYFISDGKNWYLAYQLVRTFFTDSLGILKGYFEQGVVALC